MSTVETTGPSLRMVVALGAMSRVLVLAAGVLLSEFPAQKTNMPEMRRAIAKDNHVPQSLVPESCLLVWYEADANYYLRIGVNGYEADSPHLGAFFPLLPMSIRAATWLGLNPYYAGLLIPNAAFAFGLGFFAKAVWLVSKDTRTVWRACALLCVFPTAFYCSAPYQESLGFALTAAALLAWLHRRPATSGTCAMFACLARQTSFMFGVALVLEWFVNLIRGRERSRSAWIVFVLSVFSVMLFAMFLVHRYDSASVLGVQSNWGRISPSVQGLLRTLFTGFVPPNCDYVVLIIFLALGVYVWWRYGLFWGALVVLPVLLPASTGSLTSMKRFVFACFPVFYPLADTLKNRWLFAAVLVCCIALQLFFIWRFVHGAWVA